MRAGRAGALVVVMAGLWWAFAPARPVQAFALPAYTNEGVAVNDGVSTYARFAGSVAYSGAALAAAGTHSGAIFQFKGATFQFAPFVEGTQDNWAAPAASAITLPIPAPAGSTIAFLGSSSNGPSSGQATAIFTDSTTQTFTLALSDWALSGGLSSGNTLAVATSYQDTADGFTKRVAADLFYVAPLTVPAGKSLASVTLPGSVTQGALHVFAITAILPTPAFNNEGVSPADGAATSAKFDASGNSYSGPALSAAGFSSGASLTVANLPFTWPTVSAGVSDNWKAAGQIIPLPALTGGVIGFLGAASNGASTGTVTISYTDGSTQAVSLVMSDWALGGGLKSGNQIAAQTSYRDTSSGGKQAIATYVLLAEVTLQSGKAPASVQLPTSVSGGAMHIFAIGALPAATPLPPPSSPPPPFHAGDWRGYLHDGARSSYDAVETTLTPATYPGLTQQWSAAAGGVISDQAAIVNGIAYWGSWDGLLHATSSTGVSLWTANLGQTTDPACDPPTAGVASSPAVGAVYSARAIFVGGGDGRFYAVNARNGAILWSTELGVTPSHFLWSSPLIFNGHIYQGISSFGDCPLVGGAVVEMNENTGIVEHVFHTAPAGCVGVGVWGSVTVDAATGDLYFATGNAGSCATSEPLAESVISVRAKDLAALGSWQIPNQPTGGDIDFGTTPTLFTATISGQARALVGALNKDGVYFAFDRANIAAGPVWSRQIGAGGDCPQCGSGDIAPAGFDGTSLYVGSGNVTINGVSCQGSLRALDPATGLSRWDVCLSVGHVLAAITVTPGVVIITAGGRIQAYNATTGTLIWNYGEPGGQTFYAPVSVSNGRIYVGNVDGAFRCFGL